jgi:hypothetical protein
MSKNNDWPACSCLPPWRFFSYPHERSSLQRPRMSRRGFYSWYYINSARENFNPLKQKTTALKYLTPQLYANAPRLIRRMDADIFIWPQDWDKRWSRISPSARRRSRTQRHGNSDLTLGEIDKIRASQSGRVLEKPYGWRINKVACAN